MRRYLEAPVLVPALGREKLRTGAGYYMSQSYKCTQWQWIPVIYSNKIEEKKHKYHKRTQW
jgi:hypothetical protein